MAVMVVLKMPVYFSSFGSRQHRNGRDRLARRLTDQVSQVKDDFLRAFPKAHVVRHVLEVDPAYSGSRGGLGCGSSP